VTRGTRPKKPSSSRGFAREARGAWGAWGAWGTWGLKTENRNFFLSFQDGNNYQIIIFLNKNIYIFFLRPYPDGNLHPKTSVMTTLTRVDPW
jgi:hypothetical protein